MAEIELLRCQYCLEVLELEIDNIWHHEYFSDTLEPNFTGIAVVWSCPMGNLIVEDEAYLGYM